MIMQHHRYYVINVRHTYGMDGFGIANATKCNSEKRRERDASERERVCYESPGIKWWKLKYWNKSHTNKNVETLAQLEEKGSKDKWIFESTGTLKENEIECGGRAHTDNGKERDGKQINKSIEHCSPLSSHTLDGWCILNNALFSWPFSFRSST